MTRVTASILLLVSILTVGCGGGPKLPEAYKMDKRYWGVVDYEEAVREVRYWVNDPQGLPRLSDPLTSPVVKKLIDKENVAVILEDETLGLDFRQEQSEGFFRATNDLTQVYQALDKQDKYFHPKELVELLDLNLYTQLMYFKIGNQAIIKDAVDPESARVKDVVGDNAQTIVGNFNIFISMLTKHDAFGGDALNRYAKVLDQRFSDLISTFPSSNYSKIKSTCESMLKKIENQSLKTSLNGIIEKIDVNELPEE